MKTPLVKPKRFDYAQAIDSELLKILACPSCKSEIKLKDEELVCVNDKCKLRFPIIDGIPVMLPTQLSEDLELTMEKWDEEYKNYYNLEINVLNDPELKYAHAYVKKYMKIKNGLFLEAGCGLSKLSCLLAKEGVKTVGVDLSLTGLRIGKKLFERKHLDGFFVCGNILMMPFKDNTFSFMCAYGVIEHFKNTSQAVNEIHRSLAPNGFVTATVPCVSLSIPYKMLRWGNIPDISLVRSIVELIEIRILEGRRMRFGYEKSFTPWRIRRIFENSGFKNIEIGLFETYYPLSPLKSVLLRKLITRIANTKLFWPMIYVNGVKNMKILRIANGNRLTDKIVES